MDEESRVPEGPGKMGRARTGGCVNEGPDNIGLRYSKVILILRSTIHRRGSYIQVGPTRSTVNIITSRNVRDMCGIETGEHKQRNKRESYMRHEGWQRR